MCQLCPTLEVTRPQRGLQQLCSRQICTNFHGEWDKPGSMRAVIDPGPILRRRENFRNWFSALRCILLTNNCGQSFSHPHNQDLKSAIKPKRAAFCTGTHFRKSCSRIKKCSLFVLFSQKCGSVGTGLASPREFPRQMTRSTCALPCAGPDGSTPTRSSHQGMTFKSLNIKHTNNRSAHHHRQHKSNNVKINTRRPSGNDVNKVYDEGGW